MSRPDTVKYTESHEWVKLDEKTKEAVVGITDYAVQQLSDLVHIDLPKKGDELEQGSPFGEVESVKTVADLVAPLSGKVLEVNTKLVEDLDILKEDPFQAGWIIKMKVSNASELESLMSRKEYEELLESSKEEEEDDVDEDDIE